MKKALFVLICLFAAYLFAASITFQNDDMLMHYGAPWMFNLYNPDPFNRNDLNHLHVQAFVDLCYARRQYTYVVGEGPVTVQNNLTQSTLISSNAFAPLAGHSYPDTTYHFVFGDRITNERFRISSFNHVNTVTPNAVWNIIGQAGDNRIYSGATAYIEHNTSTLPSYYLPENKLKLVNCCFYSLSPYPPAAGTGAGISGHGWGTIDPSEGDPDWIAAFTNGTGQVEYTFNSPSAVVQQAFGEYNGQIILSPATLKREVFSLYDVLIPTPLDAPQIGINLAVTAGNYFLFDPPASVHSCMAAKYHMTPTGNFPADIAKVYPGAVWEIGSTFNESTASAVFDFSDVPGVNNPQNLRLLRRANGFGSNWNDSNATMISTNPLRFEVSGYCIMGQYCLASTGGNNLEIDSPANLVISSIVEDNDHLYLSWDPVDGALYYNVYAKESPDAPDTEATLVAHLAHPICNHVISSSAQKMFYFVTSEK